MTPEELEAEVMRLRDEAGRLRDYIEIWKLQSRYSHLHHMMRMSEVPALFAQKTPGITVEVDDSGVLEGIEGVKKFFCELTGDRDTIPGWLQQHMTVNPVIEINKDRTKAKGVWHSPGLLSRIHNGKLTPCWVWGKYDMEYVKEDGIWKFWHFAFRLTFHTPYDKGWVEEPNIVSMRRFPGYKPDKPTTYFTPYSPYRINIFEPPPPEPYEE